MTAQIHGWCGQLDDPPKTPCPCRANTTTADQVTVRHQAAAHRARHGKPAPLHRKAPPLVAPHDPTGRRWVA